MALRSDWECSAVFSYTLEILQMELVGGIYAA